jgi:hypothetical protein
VRGGPAVVQLHRFVDMPSTVSIEMGSNARPVLSNLSMRSRLPSAQPAGFDALALAVGEAGELDGMVGSGVGLGLGFGFGFGYGFGYGFGFGFAGGPPADAQVGAGDRE